MNRYQQKKTIIITPSRYLYFNSWPQFLALQLNKKVPIKCLIICIALFCTDYSYGCKNVLYSNIYSSQGCAQIISVIDVLRSCTHLKTWILAKQIMYNCPCGFMGRAWDCLSMVMVMLHEAGLGNIVGVLRLTRQLARFSPLNICHIF